MVELRIIQAVNFSYIVSFGNSLASGFQLISPPELLIRQLATPRVLDCGICLLHVIAVGTKSPKAGEDLPPIQ